MREVSRARHAARVEALFRSHPVVALVGARQVGKSTLARRIAAESASPVEYFDLESPGHLARLADPEPALGALRGLVVIDEVQRRPDLFPVLRVLADRADRPARFLVLGSASRDLLRQSSESLAGRIAYHELPGLALDEVGVGDAARLWVRGGFPPSFLAGDDAQSRDWRRAFVRTFLERDLPQLGVSFPAATMDRLWHMIAHWHGQVWNASEFARSFGVAHTSVRRWLDALTATFAVRSLAPWHENVAKRQVKSPKIYVTDSGILHQLLGLATESDVAAHPKCGASWESFVIGEVVQRLGAEPEECFFWATHAGAQLDLLVVRGNVRLGFEIKRTSAPSTSKSMRIALADLKLDRLDVVHAGEHTFPLDDRIRALALTRLLDDLEGLP